jgi:hypothetical protein
MMFGEAFTNPVHVVSICKTCSMSHSVYEHNTTVIYKTKLNRGRSYWERGEMKLLFYVLPAYKVLYSVCTVTGNYGGTS